MINKKAFILILAGVGLIGISIILYFVLSHPAKSVIKEKVFWPQISADGQELYYFNNSKISAFYKTNLGTKQTVKISVDLDTPDRVVWSPDQKKALIFITYNKYIFEKYNSPFASPQSADQETTKWVYDFETNKLTQLNSNIKEVIWLSNTQIIYYFKDGNVATINTASADGSNESKIVDFGPIYLDKLLIAINNKLYFLATPGEGIRDLCILDLNTREMNIKIEDIGRNAIISPDGALALVEKNANNQTEIFWVKIENYELTKLNTETNINHFVWADLDLIVVSQSKSVYALYRYSTTNDELIKLNRKVKVGNVENLQLSPDQKTLYFTSNDILYKLDIL